MNDEKIPFVQAKIPMTLEAIMSLKKNAIQNGTLHVWADIVLDWAKAAQDEIFRLQSEKAIDECKHVIVDCRNKAIKSGYMCTECQRMFAAGDHEKVGN